MFEKYILCILQMHVTIHGIFHLNESNIAF